MHYNHFLLYNLLGAFSWVFIGLGAGYFFGNIPFVQEHFSMVVLAIVFISLIPILITNIKQRRAEQAR
jgi:membrane-associated protein